MKFTPSMRKWSVMIAVSGLMLSALAYHSHQAEASTKNPGGKGQLVSDGVQFNPWYTDEGMTTLSSAEVKPIKVAVILAETSDVAHKSDSMTAQPCKLIPEKTYANGYGKEYYTDLLYCVQQYWKDNSYGKVNLQFEVLDNGGAWYKAPKTNSDYGKNWLFGALSKDSTSQFVNDVRKIVLKNQSLDGYTITSTVFSGYSEQGSGNLDDMFTQAFIPFSLPQDQYEFVSSEHEGVGAFVHEIGHILGMILTPEHTVAPDLYKNTGNIDRWDIMAGGANGGRLMDGNYIDHQKYPTPPSTFMRMFYGWLNPQIITKSSYGYYDASVLEQSKEGDSFLKYDLLGASIVNTSDYYIIEARRKSLGKWNEGLLTTADDAIVLYRVQTNKNNLYGYPFVPFSLPYVSGMRVTIPGLQVGKYENEGDGVLNVDTKDEYSDYDKLVSFKATGVSPGGGSDSVKFGVSIRAVSAADFPVKMTGSSYESNVSVLTATELGSPPHPLCPGYGAESVTHKFLENAISAYREAKIFLWVIIVSSIAILITARMNPNRKKMVIVIGGLVIIIVASVGFIRYLPAFNYINLCGYFTEDQGGYFPGLFAPSEDEQLPSSHLEAITLDGRHIGINKTTGEWENQVTGSIVSGPNGGAPEWIYVPASEKVKYYVSGTEIERYAAAHPEVKDALMNATSTYEIYGRYVDPAAGIFTSETLKDQTLKVGTDSVFEVSGTSTPVITPKSTDIIAPEPIFSFATTTQSWVLGANEEAAIATSTVGSSDVQYVITDKAGNTTSFVASILNSSTGAMNIKSMSQNGVVSPMATTSITSYTKMTMSEPPTTYVYQNITLGSNWTRIIYNYQNQVSDVTMLANGTSTIVQMPNFQTSIVTFNHGVPTLSLKEIIVPKPQPIDIEIPIDPQPGPAPLE